jgi:hypothetical protein
MFPPGLHPTFGHRPYRRGEVNLGPAGTDNLLGPSSGQNCEFKCPRRNAAPLTKLCQERRDLLPGQSRVVFDLRDL